VKSLSKRIPVALGVNPNIVADWVIVCIKVRTDSPRCFVLTPKEVSRLAYRDKYGENYWLLATASAVRHGCICGTVGAHR